MKVYKKPKLEIKGITKQIMMQKKANCGSNSAHASTEVEY